MTTNRLEAFSDGVLAIILTIMVLELKVPHTTQIADLLPLWPVFISYVLSFIYVGIYWNNHHHLLHVSEKVSGAVLWANLHTLFWLSLIPFTTGWLGENHFAPWPSALYGFNLMMCGFSYSILVQFLIRLHGKKSLIARALGKDLKGLISVFIYLAAIPLAFYNEWISMALYAVVALIWLVPDRRIEKAMQDDKPAPISLTN